MWLNKRKTAWDSLPRIARFGLPVFFGVIASLGQAPFDLPLVALLGFATAFFLLEFAQTRRDAARLGWRFGLGYFVLTLQWLVSPFLVDAGQTGWMAPFGVLFMSAGLALFWGAAFAGAQRFGPHALVITLSIAELARAYLFTGFPWGLPSYALVNSWFGQGAAFIGPHGLNLLFFALAYALFLVLSRRPNILPPAFVSLVVGVLLLWPLPDTPEQSTGVGTIRLVQPNAPQHQKWDPEFMPVVFNRALALTAADGAPDLIIWPETSLPAALPGGAGLQAQMAAAAKGTPIVFGANRFDVLRLYNAAVYMDATGTLTQIYDKHHLVPFGEYMPFGEVLTRFGIYGLAASEGRGFSAGADAQLMDLGALGKALPLICYEAVFPQDVGAAPERPDFLMQITNDAWFGTFSGPYQHLAQSRMRAIEQGLPMVRAANTGISALIDAKGRVLAALPLNEAGFLDVTLPTPSAATLYSKTGDWPVALILVLCFLGLLAKRRRNGN